MLGCLHTPGASLVEAEQDQQQFTHDLRWLRVKR